MKEITLQVTQQQEKWLKHFANHQRPGARDNLGTYKPLHLVQTRDERFVFDDGEFGNEVAWFDSSSQDYWKTPEAVVEAFGQEDPIPYEEVKCSEVNGRYIDNEQDYFSAYGVESGFIQKVSIVYDWRTVSYHFTLQSAREYMKYQGHNLRNPRTYTVAPGYANQGDYEPFFDFLMAAGTALLECDRPLPNTNPEVGDPPAASPDAESRFDDLDYVDSEWGIGKWQGGVTK